MQRFRKTAAALSLSLLLLLSILSGCAKTSTHATEPPQTTAPAPKVREGLQTILIASLKEFSPDKSSGYRNEQQADLLILLMVDEKEGSISSLQLNPDALVTFSPQGAGSALELPLGQVFSYGSGGSDSCLSLTRSASRLLNGITIDHYMFFTLEAVGIVNRMIGGVEVEVTETLPGLEAGSIVRLSDDTINAFFDHRDDNDTANEAHMGRQQQYMMKAFTPFTAHMQQEDFLSRLTIQLGDRLSTDLTLSQMAQLMELLGTCTLDETIHTLPGNAQADGFRVDSEGAGELLNALFYD